MKRFSTTMFLVLALAPAAFAGDATPRVSGPYVHENLGIYLVHADNRELDAEILTLGAALEQGKVVVHETGNVNELSVENVSATETVLLQAGDIVKGGRQDRVISQDMVLAPRSGKQPVAAFCVERGRWSQRGSEQVAAFDSSKHSLGSKELKLAARRNADQREVWYEVAALQNKLAGVVGAPIAAAASRTSLQLSLENEQLADLLRAYEEALGPVPDGHQDVVGFAAAINGEISSAEVYATGDLFRKQWPKLLTAAATEALAERGAAKAPSAPDAERLSAFLAKAERGEETDVQRAAPETTEVRETQDSLFFETRKGKAAESWLHRSYIAK